MFDWRELFAMSRAVAAAIAVHLLMAALVVLGTMDWKPFRQPERVPIAIEAVIVDTSEIKRQRDEAKRAQELEERRQQRAEELQRQRQREAEQKRQAEEEAARRERELEAQRKREAEDRLKQLRLDRERKLEEERQRQQRQLDEIRKQREEAERKRKLEEERLKQLEAQRQRQLEDEARRQREAQQQEQERAFRAGQMATKQQQYIATIAAVVTDNWLRPPTAQAGLECRVRVVQIPGGEVISSSLVGRCNGDEATRRSILAAVERAGALPYRGFEDVFQREIEFIFTYSGD